MPVLGNADTGQLFTPAPEQIPGQLGLDRMARLRAGADRARERRTVDAYARALADTAEMPCRCGLHDHRADTLRGLGAGCAGPRWVCPRLDSMRRRLGV